VNTRQELYELSKGFDIALDVVRPPGANYFFRGQKNCLVPVTWVKIIGGGLSDGLDTRPCKIVDPRLVPKATTRAAAHNLDEEHS